MPAHCAWNMLSLLIDQSTKNNMQAIPFSPLWEKVDWRDSAETDEG
jgi:hypothetical protein